MAAASGRHGLSIFRAADAPVLRDTDFMRHSDEQMASIRLGREAIRLGLQTRLLARNAGGFSLVHAWFKPNFELPRHTHNTDCMYYVISGSAVMGKRTLRAGDSFFVPAGAPYQYTAGPDGIEVLEIRHGDEWADMTVVESDEAWEQRATRTIEANRQTWTDATTAPTMIANAGS